MVAVVGGLIVNVVSFLIKLLSLYIVRLWKKYMTPKIEKIKIKKEYYKRLNSGNLTLTDKVILGSVIENGTANKRELRAHEKYKGIFNKTFTPEQNELIKEVAGEILLKPDLSHLDRMNDVNRFKK
jgi:hypothetical protein